MPHRYTSRSWKAPSADQHFCELHHDERSLVEAIADYTFQGLSESEVVVLLTDVDRQQRLNASLKSRGVDVKRAIDGGWLRMSEPKNFREAVFLQGRPDRNRYRAFMDENVFVATRNGRRKLRIYADLVDQL